MMSLTIILCTLIRMSHSAYMADSIHNREFTHPEEVCNGKTGIKNKFDARITTVKSTELYQGTVLFVPGGKAQVYIYDEPSGTHDGIKELGMNLYNLGYRILEIRWNDKLGPDPHPKYDDAHSCQHSALGKALVILKDETIDDGTGDKWWPPSQLDRYAFGVSQGQVLLSYAIDIKKGWDYLKMNRVVYGGGGVLYDWYDQLNHPLTDQAQKDTIEFLFDGASTKCADDDSCDGDPTLRGHLTNDSISTYIGDEDDPDRVSKVLYNTGIDDSSNQYFNILHYNTRTGTSTQKGLWNFTGSWCGGTVDGHHAIDDVYDIVGDVDYWVDFFVSGDMSDPDYC